MNRRTVGAILGVTSFLAGCQILSGLSGLHDTGGTGGATSSTSMSASTTSKSVSATSAGGGGSGGAMNSATSTTSITSTTSTGTVTGCTADCGAGSCDGDNGFYVCQPYPVFTDSSATAIDKLASDGTNIYWVRSGIHSIQYAKIGDTGSQPAVADTVSQVSAMAGVSGGLLWANPTHIAHFSGGINTATETYATGGHTLQVLGNFLWWDHDMGKLSFDDLTNPKGNTFDNVTLGSTAFAVDGVSVFYWSSSGIHSVLAMNTAAMPALVFTTSLPVIQMDADPRAGLGYLYWIAGTGSSFELDRVPKTNSSTDFEMVTQLQSGAGGLIASQYDLMWSDPGGGSCAANSNVVLKRAVVDGAGHVTTIDLGTVTGCPAFAQDQGAIYYTNGKTIMRMVKNPQP